MTANEVFLRAVELLGYSGLDGDTTGLEVLKGRSIGIINQILCDLGIKDKITSIEDVLPVDESGTDTLIYGTAMMLALSENDGEKNRFFAEIYNRKRGLYKSDIVEKSDVLPSVYEGVIG